MVCLFDILQTKKNLCVSYQQGYDKSMGFFGNKTFEIVGEIPKTNYGFFAKNIIMKEK